MARTPPRSTSDAPATSAREVAVRVLLRVKTDGAYAAPVLQSELARANLDPRDSALATEIVYGVLRVWPALEARLKAAYRDPERDPDPYAQAVLLASAYQLLHLARVPPHAAVDEGVRLASLARGKPVAGFVNAVLRRVAAARPAAPERPTELVAPPWFVDALGAALGPDRARAFLKERPLPPPVGLRVRGDAAALGALLEALRAAHPSAELTVGEAPGSLLVRDVGRLKDLPGFAEGAFVVQELGAQLALALVPRPPGARVADVCAGRGGKALAVLDADPHASVVAFDLDERKLEALRTEAARLDLGGARLVTEAVDLSVGTGGYGPEFDAVIVDAPCTGLGTVQRRPEILLRLGPADPARMATLQGRILHHASGLVRDGGVLAFVVCSPTFEEGPGVARAFEAAHPEFERCAPAPVGALAADADGVVRLGPWTGDADAYQVLVWRKKTGFDSTGARG